jgi:hypothetical protein
VTSRTSEARTLLAAAAVRERSQELLDIAIADGLEHWRVDLDRLPDVAAFTAGVIRERYPDLRVPFHSRWRHFTLNGRDLWGELKARSGPREHAAWARAAFDLAITSVLLDAGAGPGWSYRDPASGLTAARSEGLAIASLRLFESGALSATPGDPLRADAETLAHLPANLLAEAFQANDDNPLLGLEGRATLLRHLGARAKARPDLFALADSPRPGGLFDAMAARAEHYRLPAPMILQVLLEALGPIWPDRLSLEGVPLGDTWRCPAIKRADATDGLLPLHKLSQWLAYSLIEPLQSAGITVTDIDGLTGLAEYRNGGLFVDKGVLALRDASDAGRSHGVGDALVVGWRGVTVALLDRIAPLVRDELGVTAPAFPLARVLEGGTWAAGRIAANALRADGGPPLKVISDGTVF